jgi:hypothetical protein
MKIMFKKFERDDAQRSLNVILGQIRDTKTLYEKQQGYERALTAVTIQRDEAYAEIYRLRGILNAKQFAPGYAQGNLPKQFVNVAFW